MTHRLLMVSKMDPEDADAVAKIFAAHDNTELPVRIGVTARTLFYYQGLTFHLIESEDDILDNVFEAHREPAFHELNESLRPFLSPIVSSWSNITDSQAREFYRRSWPAG
ncbi:MAG: TcmI family type II polyketide cyclase [Pseudonocardiaceae bacterium]